MIITIIGGTGTLANALVPLLFDAYPNSRIRVLSRGEHRQLEMQMRLNNKRLDFLVGDVRDYQRVYKAVEGSGIVFHFAAMKSVDKAEYDPREAILTNIKGTENVVDACRYQKVHRAIMTSTDKAVQSVNLYGATKLVAEKIFVLGNLGFHGSKFSVCRYGNVAGSQGSILDRFRNYDEIEITEPKMTRYFISKKDAAMFVLSSLHMMNGGEIFIPKMKSCELGELAKAMGKPFKIVGERPGEKMHECLIAKEEMRFVTDIGDRLVRWPSHELFPFKKWGKEVDMEEMTSLGAPKFSPLELKELCKAA